MDKNCSIQYENNSTMGDDQLLVCVSAPLAVFGFVFYAFVFLLGVSGNVFVILTIYKQSKLHTPFNYLVVNLAISDICVLFFSLPVVIFSECFRWPLGEIGCLLLRPSFLVFTGVSVFTMMALSFERYRAVIKPLAPKMTPKIGLRVTILIWLLACLIFGLPRSFVFGLTEEKGTLQCDPVVKNVILRAVTKVWRIFSTLIAPSIVVCFAYIRIMRKLRRELDAIGDAYASRDMARSRVKRNAKTMRLLITIIVAFVACFLPFNVVITLDDLFPAYEDWYYNETLESIFRMLQVGHSCLNPIILCLMSLEFRQALTKRFRKSFTRGRKVYDLPENQQTDKSTTSAIHLKPVCSKEEQDRIIIM